MNKSILISETEIMYKVFESDSKALEELYDIYSPLLYTLIKKIIKDDKYAEEIISNVFGIIWRKAKYADLDVYNTYTWIINLAKNNACDVLRRKLNKVSIPEYTFEYENNYIIPRLSLTSEPLDLETALSLKDKIEKALNSLTNTQQYVINLAFYEGLSQKEISEKMKIPVQTLKTKIKTVLINLHEKFTGIKSRYVIDNDVVNLIYPFVLGSLDKKETDSALNAFHSMENFPWKILGEYQNLTALLPVIHDIENPPLKLKNQIADQLYHLRRDETLRYRTISKEQDEVENSSDTEEKTKENPAVNLETRQKFERIENLLEEEKPKKTRSVEKEQTPDEDIKNETKNHTGLITIIFILILIGASAGAYFLYKDRTDNYEKQIESLNQLITSLKKENLSRPEIPGLAMLNNLKTVDLHPADLDSLVSARILLSFSDYKGYLHVKYLPPLPPNSAYQLWGRFLTSQDKEQQNNGTLLLLGTFKVTSQPEYYPFRFPEVKEAVSAEILVTESAVYGSRVPGSEVYLKGTVE